MMLQIKFGCVWSAGLRYIFIYILAKEIILQQFDAFQTEIQGSLTKRCAFNASRVHPSKVVKLPIMSPGAKKMEYLST